MERLVPSSINEAMPFDRIFGLLENEFDLRDIEKAVAKALQTDLPNLKTHKILVRLATAKTSGKLRLVTTNFDDLFDQSLSDQNIDKPCSCAPDLPDLKYRDWDGIVYLHGKIKLKENASDHLVLSARQFGRAYLAQGWAIGCSSNPRIP